MKIQLLHPNAQLPTRGTEHAAGFDIYMPVSGFIEGPNTFTYMLGFASEIPPGWVALLLPRSSAAKTGLEMANTCGVIDEDYRGEWIAKMRSKTGQPIRWEAGERILQAVLVPCYGGFVEQVESVQKSERGAGGFGSTGS